uniref:N-acetyltransferase domain-containing protein n=1 Tax=Panagrolaimus sp. ES5 TaxID=591445 RepID=A0AC34F3S8_9BILA
MLLHPAMIEGHSVSNDDVQFVDVTKDNIKIVKELNDRIFDIIYQPPFYKHILHHGKRNYNKLLKYGSMDIGVVLCKHYYLDENLEEDMRLPDGFCGLSQENKNGSNTVSPNPESQTTKEAAGDVGTSVVRDAMLYISAFGLIPMFRSQGIGKLMIKHVLKVAEDTPGVKYIGLHVHSPNKEAIKFYKKNGFVAAHLFENYYLRLEPRSAYFLVHFPKALNSTKEKSHNEESEPQK